nr:hypothetical protein [Tanacetum cinerariifolium]
AATTSASTDKAGGKTVKEKPPRVSQGPHALPSNWARYEDEDDPMTENQVERPSSQQSDVVVPKSKGADYAYLLSEAKSQNSMRSLEIFPSIDDFISGRHLCISIAFV